MSDAPVRVSWSQIRTSEECKQKGYLHRLGKRNSIANTRMFFPGTVVDTIMRTWLDGDDPRPGEMARMVGDIIELEEKKIKESSQGVLKWKDKSDKAAVTATCIEAATKLEPLLFQRVLPYDWEPAKRFKTQVKIPSTEGIPITIELVGEMDLLVKRSEDDYYIYDLKITRDKHYWRKTLGQLTFYDICNFAMFGKFATGSALLQPLCDEQILDFKFSNSDYASMWNRVHRYAISRWDGNVDPKKGPEGCSWCDVKHACSKYRIGPASSLQGERESEDELSILFELEKS